MIACLSWGTSEWKETRVDSKVCICHNSSGGYRSDFNLNGLRLH